MGRRIGDPVQEGVSDHHGDYRALVECAVIATDEGGNEGHLEEEEESVEERLEGVC